MKKLILTLSMLLCIFSVNVSAQTDEEFDLMQRAQMVAEIKQLRAVNSGLTTQVTELKAQVDTYKRLDTVQEARIGDLKEALKYRTEANNISVKVEDMYKAQIADYRSEMTRLREENEKLRKSRDRRGLIMGIIGVAAGALIF